MFAATFAAFLFTFFVHQHFHRLMARALRVGLPFGFFIGPFMPLKRAQNDLFLAPPPGCGALRLEPVARLYLALPLAVKPPLRDFSPLPRDRLTPFRFLFGAIF